MHLRSNSIKKQLTWMSMLASSCAMLLACAAFVVFETVTFRTEMVSHLDIRAQIIGLNSVSALTFSDPQSAATTLSALKADPHIVAAALYGRDGKLFAGYHRIDSSAFPPLPEVLVPPANSYRFDGQQLLAFRAVILEGDRVGTVCIQSDLAEVKSRLLKFGMIGVIVFLTSLLLAFVISARLQKPISGTVLHLAETALAVSNKKDYSVRAASSSRGDELALLTNTFNEMLSQIQRRDQMLEQERHEVERRVEERTAELQAANKELEAFTYSVSHDLRAPLRHIDGFSKLLLEENSSQLSEDAREYISYIRDGTSEMSQLVDDLLNLARVGRKDLIVDVTGLTGIVDEVVANLKTANPNRMIQWKITPLPFVECDPALMRQVFVNLLSNAVKYSRQRELAVIEVGALEQADGSVIFVRDNGVGFSMKHANKLFGVFQRLHRREDFEGTGVGLAIVHRIIQKHGGRVWAEAELNQGATFFFRLNAPKDAAPPKTDSEKPEVIYGG